MIFTVIIVALFAALAIITTVSNKQKAEGNPYGKDKLDPATIQQLDDPNYQNQVLPEELRSKIKAGESVTVYFYDPTCVHCKATTPVIVPMTNGMGLDLKKLNLREFRDGWNEYGIEATPTLIHFKDGKEVKRLVGSNEDSVFEEWFLDIVGQ